MIGTHFAEAGIFLRAGGFAYATGRAGARHAGVRAGDPDRRTDPIATLPLLQYSMLMAVGT